MATKKDSARVRIDNIKTDLRSLSTCTITTVSNLQELLAEKLDESIQKENLGAKTARAQGGTRRNGAAAAARTTAASKKPAPCLISARDKYILATEVANATLKTLADALKNPPNSTASQTSLKSNTTTNANAPKSSQQRPNTSRTPSCSQRPLQERSPSQATNSPTKPSAPRRLPSHPSCGPNSNLVAAAECARTAFAYLRTPEAARVAGKDAPALQQENGLLSLVGKLVSHGLDSLAIKELRVLKRRLDRFLGNENKDEGNKSKVETKSQKKAILSVEKDNLASLLNFGDVDLMSPALPIVTNHQMYALRVIARLGRPQSVEEAWTYLKLANPSSPANLLWHMAKAKNEDSKSIRQLETLAQAVLSMCPSISTSDDGLATDKTLHPAPDVVLSLQHLAFMVRQRWWTLAKHQGNIEKELSEPFAKCLVAFSRRSRLSAVKKYRLAELLHKELQSPLQCSDESQRRSLSLSASTSKILSSLAQTAGQNEEALRWMSAPGQTAISEASLSRNAVRIVRTASLSMDAVLKGNRIADLTEVMTDAVSILSGSLEGSPSELESLFTETNALRRIVSRGLVLHASQSVDGTPANLCADESLAVVKATVRFCARFLGPTTLRDAATKVEDSRRERLRTALKHVKSIIDSVSICSKLPVRTEADAHWADFDALIQDCLSILQHFEQGANELKLPDDVQCPFIKISNCYWAVHLQLKLALGIATPTIRAMQRSIIVLQNRPQVEHQSGMLTMKLERLGDALDSTGLIDDAREAYSQCITEQVDSGILQELTLQASRHSLWMVFEANETAATFGRLLNSYHRSSLKSNAISKDNLALFDNTELASTERGVLLEWQLAFYLKSLSKNRTWDSVLNHSVHAISEKLLGIYSVDAFPVRRQRVILTLYQLSQEHPDVLPPTMVIGADKLPHSSAIGTKDQELVRYEAHLQALLRLRQSIQESVPELPVLQESFGTWHKLIQDSRSWENIVDRIDNVVLWIQSMETTVQYLQAKGEEYFCIAVLRLLVNVYELQKGADLSPLIGSLCELGGQLSRLGYSGKAGLAFAKAQTKLTAPGLSTKAKLQWHIAHAEYLLGIGNITKSETALDTAKALAQQDTTFMSLAKPGTPFSGRLQFNKLLADACYVNSLLAARKGKFMDAARYTKQNVTLNRRIWATLEGQSLARKSASNDTMPSRVVESGESNFNPLSSLRNEKGIPIIMSNTHECLDSSEFWSLVPSLYRGLIQQSTIFSQQGLLHEAIGCAEQAEKVAMATRSRSFMIEATSVQAQCWAKSGRFEKSEQILRNADASVPYKHLCMAGLYSSMAHVAKVKGEIENELAAYEACESLLASLTHTSFVGSIDSFHFSLTSLEEKLSAMSLAPSDSAPGHPARPTRGRKPAQKAVSRSAPKKTRKIPHQQTLNAIESVGEENASVQNECFPLQSLRADVIRNAALASIDHGDLAKATDLLGRAQEYEKSLERSILYLWVSFKTLFAQGMEELGRDVTLNTLPESTVAFPSIGPKDRRPSEEHPNRRPKVTATTGTKGSKGKKSVKEDFVAIIHDARDRLVELHAVCSRSGSSYNLRQSALALGQITVLLSAISGSDVGGSIHPVYAAYMSELPKHNALRLCQEAVRLDQQSLSREDCLKWPDLDISPPISLASATEFQREYIDIIPANWTAISLALSEKHDELYITRYEADHTPFVLRMPLARHMAREMDEEEFSFEDGKRDFDEIIELSDFSTRTAKDMTSKEARLQWWSEREALDTKLHELLLNIENIWLGGFRGIFSQHPHKPSLLARFRKSFEDILNRHLPSRQTRGQQKKLALDARVLELFIGLGDPTSEELDLDEALMDLVYFIVDILQFNGERNAYDEVDFDAIVIETLDALRAYHSSATSAMKETRHVVLILDNNLHGFPWESLPCLQPLSISRLPSLAALRERILWANPSASPHRTDAGHYILAANGGTSILNPSGDLSHTLKILKPRLDVLPGPWTHIANRSPSEDEFENALKEKDLVLYFGHGSGSQYVRSKSVRRLYPGGNSEEPGCATTFLFGCSSVHLSENGTYEPSGMLASYLTAGAPAVVGMLWDVTDKDCDRFAVKAGEVWGLWANLDETADVSKTPKTLKGKGKVKQRVAEVESARGATAVRKTRNARSQTDGEDSEQGSSDKSPQMGPGLDEAVRIARDACVLRYLNGAAAVVYGIPTYLE